MHIYDEDPATDAEMIAQAETARREYARTYLPELRERVIAVLMAENLREGEDACVIMLGRFFDEIGDCDELIIRQMLYDVVCDGTWSARDVAHDRVDRLRLIGRDHIVSELEGQR